MTPFLEKERRGCVCSPRQTGLTIDYTTQQAQIDDAYRRARQRGYVPFCTVRALSRLLLSPRHLPD